MSEGYPQGGEGGGAAGFEGGPREAGALLRKARMDRGLSLEEIAQATRVPKGHLEAIERGDMAALPPGPFAKGFVTSYARHVGLDPQHVGALVDGAPLHVGPEFAPETGPGEGREGGAPPASARPRKAILGALVVSILVALGVVFRPGGEGEPPAPTPPLLQLELTEEGPAAERESILRLGVAEGEWGGPVAYEVFSDSERGDAPHRVKVVATHRTYARVSESMGGEALFEGILEAGASETFTSEDELWIILGNAGAAQVTYMDAAIRGLGPDGDRRGLAFRGP